MYHFIYPIYRKFFHSKNKDIEQRKVLKFIFEPSISCRRYAHTNFFAMLLLAYYDCIESKDTFIKFKFMSNIALGFHLSLHLPLKWCVNLCKLYLFVCDIAMSHAYHFFYMLILCILHYKRMKHREK